MSSTDDNSPIYVPPPRLTGDPATDSLSLADYNASQYQALTLPPASSINPTSLPDSSNSTINQSQSTANIAYQFCLAINTALGNASVPGFPLTPPTTETTTDS